MSSGSIGRWGLSLSGVAGIDHDTRHGDPNERRAIPHPDAAAGLCGRNDGGGFFGPRIGSLQF